MKKLIGLLATGTMVMFAACSSDDNSVAPANSVASSQADAVSCLAIGKVLGIDPLTNLPACVDAVLSSSSIDPTSSAVPESSQPGNTAESSSDAAPATTSSSSVAPSSSATPAPASSAPAADEGSGEFVLGLWDGSTGTNQVPTGNKDGGYWYSYTDKGNSGSSTIAWDATATVGSDYSADDLTPIITECGGLCAKFNLVAGANEDCAPYVAVAFNYGKTDKVSGDATASKGICVTYKSSNDIEVDLGLGETMDNSYGYNLPAYKLDASTSLKTVDLSWDEFKQQWEGAKALTGPEAAKMLAAIKFQVKGTAVGEDGGEGTFLITKVGAAGKCGE